jgi:hypothetical protein
MKSRDQLLLENIYSRMILKEDPDECWLKNRGEVLSYEDEDAQTFGFFEIDGKRTYNDLDPYSGVDVRLEFSNFGSEWKNKIIITEPDEEETHPELVEFKLAHMLLNSPTGIIKYYSSDTLQNEVDLSKLPSESRNNKSLLSFLLKINPRKLLTPCGRIWLDSRVISFWSVASEVKLHHLNLLQQRVGVNPERFKIFQLEFLNNEYPKTTVRKFMGLTDKPKETTPEEKKRMEDALRKAHGAGALETKDKDVQDIIDKRKKDMAAAESKLRAKGIRPDLKTRQQAMTSESIQQQSR